MPNPASIRLGTTGKAQVKADFAETAQAGVDSFTKVGDAAAAQARRWAREEEKARGDIEASRARLARAELKSALFKGTASPIPSASNDQSTKDAEQSARIAAAAYEQMQRRANALVAAIDPAFAAQQRFNREIGEARGLVSAGVLSLDQYVAVLRQEQAALDAVGATGKRTGNAFAAAAPQIQDLFTQISMGGNPVNALVVQGGQLAGQLQYAGGKAASFASFMMGPWGIALQVGLLVFSPLLGKLLEFNNAVDDGVEKLKKDAKETENTRIAKERFARSTEGVAASIREQAEALDNAAKGERSAAERANIQAKENLKKEMSIRAVTAAMLDQAIAQENIDKTRAMAPGQRGELGTLALTESSGRVAGLQAQLKANQTAIDQAKRNLMGTRIDLATEAAGRSTDPMAQIKKRYDELAEAARSTARARIKAGQDVDASLTRELAAIERNRAAAVKAEQDKQKASRATAKLDSETLRANDVARMLRTALPGVQVTSTTGGQHVKNSYHYRNQAVDFVPAGGMQSMSKADVRKIFESRGIDIVELLGPGDKGHSDHFHVAWTKGKLALDGFNDAAKRNKEGQRDLAAANKELESDLADIVTRFDPARAAGDELAETLAKIAALQGKGKLTVGQAQDYGYAALVKAQEAARERQTQLTKTVLGDFEDPFAVSNATREDDKAQWTEEQNRRQQVQENGVRTVSGLYRNLMSGGTRSIFDSFRQMGIDAIADLAAKWTLSQIGKLSGSGGILGSLASLVSGVPKVGATASPVRTTGPAYAVGTEYASGGASLVGEFGAEIVNVPRGSRVTPAGETRRMLAGNDNRPALTNHFHLEGAVVTQDLVDQMNAIGSGAAVRGAYGGSEMAKRDLSRSQSRTLS